LIWILLTSMEMAAFGDGVDAAACAGVVEILADWVAEGGEGARVGGWSFIRSGILWRWLRN
jgi:hypothetical protein